MNTARRITTCFVMMTAMCHFTFAQVEQDATKQQTEDMNKAVTDTLNTNKDILTQDNISGYNNTDTIYVNNIEPITERDRRTKQITLADSLENGIILLTANDTITNFATQQIKSQKQQWIPNPKKALWMAIVIPGGGQIYNRKYWKLPIIYGGFMGCMYAMSWNNTMYHDYAQAYIDIMDDDPNTRSYVNFLPPTYDAEANKERLQTLFKKKKDYYRRFRDLSIFCTIGVYALSVIDAYVDAELSSFDISRDLTMKIRPSVISDHSVAYGNGSSYGVKCAISF